MSRVNSDKQVMSFEFLFIEAPCLPAGPPAFSRAGKHNLCPHLKAGLNTENLILLKIL